MIDKIKRLRDKILDSSNSFCFIERETILRECAAHTLSLPEKDRYVYEFEQLTGRLSTLCDDENLLAGRMLEGPWRYEEPFTRIPGGVWSMGHITFDWPRIIHRGLESFAEEIDSAASRTGTVNTRFFADCTRRCLDAAKAFAHRYAAALRKAGRNEAADALDIVPYKPAYSFFSAVQSVWFWHFIMSCICGTRDFALGRLDEYLLPFYRADIASGRLTRDGALELMTHLFLKTNELAGTCTDDYKSKPVLCHASKQYVTLRGDRFNELTEIIIEAAKLCGLTQPTLNFRMCQSDPESAWKLAGRGALLPSIPNFFNGDVIHAKLLAGGIEPADADNYDFTGCNRVNIPGKLSNIMSRIDRFNNSALWFTQALHEAGDPKSIDEILDCFSGIIHKELSDYAEKLSYIFTDGQVFSLDSLTVDSCIANARDMKQGGADKYRWQHHMFSGIATIGDSLAAIDRIVFKDKRMSYQEFMAVVDSNFKDADALRTEIATTFPKFGNDDKDADQYTVATVNCLLDAMDDVGKSKGFMMFASLYSLNHHHRFGKLVQATPNGRLAGEPLSENMSPTYGADKNGPTALLKSVSRLPMSRLICGGLNLKFGHLLEAEDAGALLRTYFMMGGIHLGFSMVSKAMLEEARKSPMAHRTLLVRKFGFSEYYVSLSPAYQQELIDRTEY